MCPTKAYEPRIVTCPPPARSRWPRRRTLRASIFDCVSTLFIENPSLHLSAGGFNDRGPFGNFRLDIGGELLRRAANEIDAEIGERGLDRRIRERRPERAVERCNHLLRRTRGRNQPVPRRGVEILDAELVDGRNVGQDRAALEAGDCKRTHFALLDVRNDGRGGG